MLPLLPIALALIAGIVTGDATRLPLTTWITAAGIALAAAFALRCKAAIQHAAILLVTFFLGAALIVHTRSQLHPSLPIGRPVAYRAVVISKPVIHGRVITCDMAVSEAEGRTLSRPTLVKAAFLRDTIQNRWRTLCTGLCVEACSTMELPANFHTAPRFNYVRWMHVHGFTARTFILPRSWQTASEKGISLPLLLRIRLKAAVLRDRLLATLDMPRADDQRYAVIAAMTQKLSLPTDA